MAPHKVVVQISFAFSEGVVPTEDDISALLNKFAAGLKDVREQHPDLPPGEVTALTVPAESVLHLSAPQAPTETPAPAAEAPAPKAAPAPEASKPEDLGRIVRDIHIAWQREQPQFWPGKSPDFHALLEADREVYTRIGEALWKLGFAEGQQLRDLLVKQAFDEGSDRRMCKVWEKIDARAAKLRKRRPKAWRRRVKDLIRLADALNLALPVKEGF